MIYHEANVIKILEKPLNYDVYYFFSTEEYLARRYAEKTIALLQKDVGLLKDSDLKRLSAHFRSKIDTPRQSALYICR